MTTALYPMYLFRVGTDEETGKPFEPRVVRSDEEHDRFVSDGWAESPEEAAGQPRAHAPIPEADRAARSLAAVSGADIRPRVLYPMWLFALDGRSTLVYDPGQRATLEEETEWFESPADAKKAAKAKGVTQTPPAEVVAKGGNIDLSDQDAPLPPAPDVNKANSETVIAWVKRTDLGHLQQLGDLSQLEASGPNRVSVLRAIETHVERLTRPPKPAPDAE